MKVVYFYDNKRVHRFMGFGQMTTLAQACYFRAMELGYDKVIVEWHNMVTYLWDDGGNFKEMVNIPGSSIIPIIFVQKGTRVANYIEKIDLSEPNSLYTNCPPIIANPMNMRPIHSYLNKYYMDTGKRPIFNIESDDVENYIIFHYRDSKQRRQRFRNTPLKKWKWIKDYIKQKYGDKYKLIKIGEPSPIDDEFDEVIGYFNNNMEDLFRLINNTKMFICSAAGPVSLAYMLGIPSIVFYDEGGMNSVYGTNWSEGYDNIYGKSVYDWINKNILLGLPISSDELYVDSIIEYTEKIL